MTGQASDFVILGPAMSSGRNVIDAIYALYFLPEHFKLILAGSETAGQSFFVEVRELVARNGLEHRVIFGDSDDTVQAVILPNTGMSRAANSVAGDSPEALASALFNVYRTRFS